MNHPDYKDKVMENPDAQNRAMAFGKIIKEVMTHYRKLDIQLYRKFVQDEGFAQAIIDGLKRYVEQEAIKRNI